MGTYPLKGRLTKSCNKKQASQVIIIACIVCTGLWAGLGPRGTMHTPRPSDNIIPASWIQSNGALNGQTFNHPSGIAVNGTGYVYVCDTNNNRIQVFTPTGQYSSSWGLSGSGNGQLSSPFGIAINATGAVYIADSGNQRVQVFSSMGTYLTQWGQYGNQNGNFSQPEGIAINATGHVYVADTFNHRMQIFYPNGTFIYKWGKNGGDGTLGSLNGEFNRPTSVAINSGGLVHVAESGNWRVQIFSSTGQFQGNLTGITGSHGANGIAFNSTGYIFVTDSDGSNSVNIYSPTGTWFASITLGGTVFPWGIAINATQHIFIPEYMGNQVVIYRNIPIKTGNGNPLEGPLLVLVIVLCVAGPIAAIAGVWYWKKSKSQHKHKLSEPDNAPEF